ncbi:hypothetical protein HY418_02290 [Candidatus Kaiserbacteria bacterium]|nr:hypothetical protein [Candidatus Kaiserbacteria bacterium]
MGSFEEASVNNTPSVEQGKDGYGLYRKLGGASSEEDYKSVLREADTIMPSETSMMQAEHMARHAKIELQKDGYGSVVRLYAALRDNERYVRTGDQEVFAEALRILGDANSLKKFTEANIEIFSNYTKRRPPQPDAELST